MSPLLRVRLPGGFAAGLVRDNLVAPPESENSWPERQTVAQNEMIAAQRNHRKYTDGGT
ncbi:hypothetical protein [Polymorphobacter megasporae]|uniref:hypothetical protein n=1 Tax=Glacieibacterium megasporae TaxID=2835787 RepID=UPI001C1E39CB|nr:hypothetical protein [Polymorphobacter megasporae]UAJ09927.1 hypothetical protein KTC28_16805 [Polymorphobacter megasporae]